MSDKLEEDDFRKKFGTLYQNLKIGKKSRKGNLYWLFVYLMKRYVLAMITVFFDGFAWGQISGYISM